MKNIIINLSIFICILCFENIKAQSTMCEAGEISPIPTQSKGDDIPTPTYPPAPPPPPGPPPGPGEYRMLYWVHGMNGTSESWNSADAAVVYGASGFPARKAYTFLHDYYAHQNTLESGSSKVKQEMAQTTVPVDVNKLSGMVIAHSQGGLVSRKLDMYLSQQSNAHERHFGGIITLASANQGAQLLNNEVLVPGGKGGQLTALVESFSRNLSAGPVAEIEHSEDILFRIFGELVNVGEMLEFIRQTLTNNVINHLANKNLPGIVQEMTVGSPSIQELNTYTPYIDNEGTDDKTNLVAFYAVRDTLTSANEVILKDEISEFHTDIHGDPYFTYEDKVVKNVPLPISWVTLNYFLHSPNEVKHPQDPFNKKFTALYGEGELPARVHLTRLDYEARVKINHDKYLQALSSSLEHGHSGFSFFDAIIIKHFSRQATRAKSRQAEWQKGVDFLDNFDRMFRTATGARVRELTTQGTSQRKCICEYDDGTVVETLLLEEWQNCSHTLIAQEGGDCRVETQYNQVPVMKWRYKESDGIVLAESASYIPQATYNNPGLLKLTGSTHMCVRNDDNTKEMLLRVFDGDVGLFFETEEK